MGQLSVATSLNPWSGKKKLLTAIATVVVGHVGVLWALYHMDPIQLRPLELAKPIKVKFVKIVEKPKAEAPKPKEPEKPKTPPKPKEVKIVEKPLPPKKVEKIEVVKKVIPEPKVEMPPIETTTISISRNVVSTPIPEPQATKASQSNPAPAVDNTPRDLGDASGVAWKRKPRPRLSQDDLQRISSKSVVIRIDVDAKGKIKARIVRSSGDDRVDKEVIRAVQAGQFYPYKENGVAVPFFAEQPFYLQ